MDDLLANRPARPPARRPRRLPKPVGLAVVATVLLALVLVLVLGVRAAASRFGSSSADYTGEGVGRAVVRVQDGDTAAEVGATLVAQGVVRSTGAFRSAAQAEPRSRGLQPGFYALRKQMSAKAALALLLDPSSRLRGRVTVPEGSTLSQVLQLLAKNTEVPLAQYQQAARSPGALGLPPYAKGRLEGFLFPATYDVEPGTSAEAVLRRMVDRWKDAAGAVDLEARATAAQRSPYDVLVVASLIEKETAFPDDRAKVARVVYNRLADGMPLQLDSTVNYVRTERAARLSVEDLKVESPYNTYQQTGLPPTPIDSPGQAALEAALNPVAGDFRYFVTIDKQGRSLFTADYQEFLRAKAKAKRDGVY
jgi:UPF0755 protein